MPTLDPVYTAENCEPAFQLRWSLALFEKEKLNVSSHIIDELKQSVETDGLRILEYSRNPPRTHFFLVSTKPFVKPSAIIRSVKGRLQNSLINGPRAFRRNFALTSVGDVNREVVDRYVATQLAHHRMADARVQHRLSKFQFEFPEIDLSKPSLSSHGQYLYNVHLVLVHQERWRCVDEAWRNSTAAQAIAVANKKDHRLARLSLLSDHLHMLLGCGHHESPQDVAMGYLNNLAYSHRMAAVYCHGYYAGTFGEYDMDAIRRRLA